MEDKQEDAVLLWKHLKGFEETYPLNKALFYGDVSITLHVGIVFWIKLDMKF